MIDADNGHLERAKATLKGMRDAVRHFDGRELTEADKLMRDSLKAQIAEFSELVADGELHELRLSNERLRKLVAEQATELVWAREELKREREDHDRTQRYKEGEEAARDAAEDRVEELAGEDGLAQLKRATETLGAEGYPLTAGFLRGLVARIERKEVTL